MSGPNRKSYSPACGGLHGAILARQAQRLDGWKTYGEKEKPAPEEFRLKGERYLMFGQLKLRGGWECQTQEALYYLDSTDIL